MPNHRAGGTERVEIRVGAADVDESRSGADSRGRVERVIRGKAEKAVRAPIASDRADPAGASKVDRAVRAERRRRAERTEVGDLRGDGERLSHRDRVPGVEGVRRSV